MNKFFILILIIMSLHFVGCAKESIENNLGITANIITTNTPTPTQSISKLEFKALYASISNSNPSFDKDAYVFNDVTSLTEYITNNGNESYFNSKLYFTESASENENYTISAVEKYNEDFFNNNTVILYIFIAGSLNMYHEVQEVLQENGRLYVNINGYVPRGDLPAEKTCYILIEMPKNDELTYDDMNITFNDYVFLDED